VRVEIAYDGTRFYGWQRQEGFLSVQQALEEALLDLVGERVVVHGAGRTDTGVHALAQVASFHVTTPLPDERLLFALNAHLPEGVVLNALETCADAFHAQYAAAGKRYAYLVRTSPFRPPFPEGYAHWVHDRLDVGRMRSAAAELVGEHDFSAFANAGSPRRSNVRVVRSLHVVARRRSVVLVVQGNGFLYNMVRTIAGTLLDVGRGKLSPSEVGEILASGDRKRAGPTAPAAGLYLLAVLYAESCFPGRSRGRGAGAFASGPRSGGAGEADPRTG